MDTGAKRSLENAPLPLAAARAGARWRPGTMCLAIAAVALGLAIHVHFGLLDPMATPWLTLGVVAAIVGMAAAPSAGRYEEIVVLCLLAAGLATQFIQLLLAPPTVGKFTPLEQYLCNLIVIAAIACAVGIFWPRLRFSALLGLLALHLLLGILLICTLPTPHIDVYYFLHDAGTALLHGHNPYAVILPDIYWPDDLKAYGPGAGTGGWLRYGYPYPPVPMLFGLPGLLIGDFRYAYLLAVTATGAFIATMRRRTSEPGSVTSVLAAALLLFLPSQCLVVQMGWVEPVAILLLSATVWTALRHPRWLALPLGLLLVSKQTMIFAVPAVWLLLPAMPAGRRGRILLETVVVGAAATLPLAILGGRRFWQSVVVWQFHQPFRTDSLSFPAWLISVSPGWASRLHVMPLAPVVAFVLAIATLAVCLRLVPRTPAGFAATIGVTMLVFFAFNKQAFCNYYYFVIASFCIAIAAQGANCLAGEPTRRADY